MVALNKIREYWINSKVKVALLVSFSLLLLTQILLGFKYFEDYLILFIFVLFLNDQFFKFKHPERIFLLKHEKKIRLLMTILFLLLFTLPLLLDYYNVPLGKQMLLYKLGFIVWAQVFLVDAFYHYKETNSKKWLLFANTAMAMIVIGAFVI